MNTEFKVGDKVKVLEKGTAFTGRVGVIYEVRGPERTFKYAAYFGDDRWDYQPFRPCDLKAAPTKGEQLLLFEL